MLIFPMLIFEKSGVTPKLVNRTFPARTLSSFLVTRLGGGSDRVTGALLAS